MKKNMLIMGTILCIVGIIIMGISISLVDFNFDKLNNEEAEKSEQYSILGSQIDNIEINIVDENIKFILSDDDNIYINYYQNNKKKYNITNENNTLRFNRETEISLFNFSIFSRTRTITVKIPKNKIYDLQVNNVSGNININNFEFKNLNLKTVSGDINVSNIKSNKGNLKSTSGDMNLNSIDFKTSEIRTVSGEIEIDSAKINNTQLNTTSGDFEIGNSKLTKLNIGTVSGDIDFENLTTDNLKISTVSGDIEGNIIGNRQDYNTDFNTTSGDSNIGKFEIKENTKNIIITTTSGDANIIFSNQK